MINLKHNTVKLLDRPDILISVSSGKTNKAVLVFSSYLVQDESYFISRSDDTHIFIADRLDQWGNSFNLDEILSTINPYINDKEVYCIGSSLGGFLSIIFSNILNAKACIAFVPQYTPFSDVLGQNFWPNDLIKSRHPMFDKVIFNQSCQYFIVTTNDEEDLISLPKFINDQNENIHILIFDSNKKFLHHNLAKKIKSLGLMDALVFEVVESNSINNFMVKVNEFLVPPVRLELTLN